MESILTIFFQIITMIQPEARGEDACFRCAVKKTLSP